MLLATLHFQNLSPYTTNSGVTAFVLWLYGPGITEAMQENHTKLNFSTVQVLLNRKREGKKGKMFSKFYGVEI